MCRWQVQVSVYCAWRMPAHLRCTQCSIMLHLIDICFLPCICLWQISQFQICLCVVVGPIFVSKRRNLQALELSLQLQTAVEIVSKTPAPSNGGSSQPCGPAGWLGLLLINEGDVETNMPNSSL